MTVKQLRDRLAAINDDALVVVPDFDHSYRATSRVIPMSASLWHGELFEWADGYSEGEKVPVVVIE